MRLNYDWAWNYWWWVDGATLGGTDYYTLARRVFVSRVLRATGLDQTTPAGV